MAPRGYLAEVALLTSASEDLAAVGPGEREGWLDDPAVLPSLAPRARALAVASAARSVLAVVPVAGVGGGVTVRPALGPDDGRISAVEWIPLAGEDPGEAGERVAVAVGTDARWLLLYSLAGDLLHKQVAMCDRSLLSGCFVIESYNIMFIRGLLNEHRNYQKGNQIKSVPNIVCLHMRKSIQRAWIHEQMNIPMNL